MVVLVVLVQLVSKRVLVLPVRLMVDAENCPISSLQVLLLIQECAVGWRCQLTVGREAKIEAVEQPLWPYSEWLPSGSQIGQLSVT